MPVKGGCFVDGMFLNDDCTVWNIQMTVSTQADNGSPQYSAAELAVSVGLSEAQTRAALIDKAKQVITANFGIPFSGSDTVQLWFCSRTEG